MQAFQIPQMSEVKELGHQLKDSCSDKDHKEINMQLQELSTLWDELQSIVQQRIQYQQKMQSLRGYYYMFIFCHYIQLSVGQLNEFMAWLKNVDIKLTENSAPGVEPSEVENKIANLEVYLLISYSSVACILS